MKRIAMQIAAAFGAVAMFVGSAGADYKLEHDETWTDVSEHPGTIDLAGHKLTVNSLTGDATITSTADAGYEILEYIDSDGKAYIDTGVTVASDTVIDIKLQLLKNPNGAWVSYVGAREKNNTDSQFGGWFHGLRHYTGVTAQEADSTAAAVNTDYTVHLDKGGICTINGDPFVTGSGVGNEYSIMVFGLSQKNSVDFRGSFRVYSCRIAYGDVVQRDLKPARRLSDGTLGLLDVKNEANLEFYENKDSSGAFTAGPVVSNEFAKPAELHVAVASGETANSTVAITGPVRLVKEGAGTFVATKQGQTYRGGTDVAGGTFKCGADGQYGVYGMAGSTVTVRDGATLDFDGWANHTQYYFVLNGGTLKSATNRGKSGNSWISDVTLTKDSFMSGGNYGFVGSNWAESTLRMNGYTLTVDVAGSQNFYMGNIKVEGGGEIYARTGGFLSLGGNPSGSKPVTAKTTTLRMGGAAIYDGGGVLVFGSYVSEYAAGWDTGNTVIKVLDRFVPGKQWHATELQDGATLVLSAYGDAWNVTCNFTHGGAKSATFAANATINLELGNRELKNGMKLIGWTEATAPLSTVKFKLPDEVAEDFMLAPGSDGLYVEAAVKAATWTGAIDTDCTKSENWTCYDANGNVIAGARPGNITAVTVSGNVQLDIPANSLSCASFTCDNVSLKGDCNWSGLGQPLNDAIDLAGHKFTVSSLTGDATITSAADAGYEILEYIDSDGKAYVNTGVTVAPDTVIDIKLQLLKDPVTSYVSYVGAREANSTAGQLGGWFYGLQHHSGVTANERHFGNVTLNADYLVHLDKSGSCKIDGDEFATGSGVGNDYPITVFGMNQSTGVSFIGLFRVYFCRIAYGDEVQRDLKPARRLSDGALGLLDVKNEANLEFYENKDSSGAFTAGPVVSNEFAKPAELHVAVASGETANSTVAITGPVRVVKEGAGTFVATKQGQTYTGGTDVKAGTFSCGGYGKSHVYGADWSTVTVRDGATFDCAGWADHTQFHFVLDGGTVKNENDIGLSKSSWFADMTLTKNSFMKGGSYGFVGSGWAEGRIRMNGYTLTIDVAGGKDFYMGNVKVEGGGEIYGNSGGYLAFGGNPTGGKYVKAETTTLRMGGTCIRDGGGEYVFGSYVSEHIGGWERGTPSAFKVLNRFVPGEEWHKTELQDGATLDLSSCVGTWNVSCTPPNSEGRTFTATFAEGATIDVELGDRTIGVGEKVIGWTPETVPAKGVKFLSKLGKLRKMSDGAYYMQPFMIMIR